MTTLQKAGIAFFGVVALLGGVAFFGWSPFIQPMVQQLAGSPVGTTFNTAKIAAINWTLGTGATTTSILNTDASDRYILSLEMGCQSVGTSQTPLTGAGLLALTVKAATTSTAAPAVISNTNIVGNSGFTLGTSSAQFVISSSTAAGPGGFSGVANVWLAGSYMTFWSNATNTAACVTGVRYLAS